MAESKSGKESGKGRKEWEKESAKGEKNWEKEEKRKKKWKLGAQANKKWAKKLKRGSFSNLRKIEPSLSLLFCMHTLSLPCAYINKALGTHSTHLEQGLARGDSLHLHPQP